MKKILVLPGWMTSIKLYSTDAKSFDTLIGKVDLKTEDADYTIGVSLGALVVLRDIPKK